ncbi:MAG: hypothetical protein AB1635_07740 [Acidobacteriota bacterium]
MAEDPLVAPMPDAETRDVGGAQMDIVRAGAARVKRLIYPPGFRWSANVKPMVNTERCMHAHVGFLARGRITVHYPDGCTVAYAAPQVLVIEPGHDAAVEGPESAVLIEFDFERETVGRLGLAGEHRHR